MVSPMMSLEDLFYWESQHQFKMGIFWEGWSVADLIVPSTTPCDSSYPNLKSTIWMSVSESPSTFLYDQKREITIFRAQFIWPSLDVHFWLRWIKPQFPLTIMTTVFLVPVTGKTSELLRHWYLPIRWSQLRNLSLEKNPCESQVICRAGPMEW